MSLSQEQVGLLRIKSHSFGCVYALHLAVVVVVVVLRQLDSLRLSKLLEEAYDAPLFTVDSRGKAWL